MKPTDSSNSAKLSSEIYSSGNLLQIENISLKCENEICQANDLKLYMLQSVIVNYMYMFG